MMLKRIGRNPGGSAIHAVLPPSGAIFRNRATFTALGNLFHPYNFIQRDLRHKCPRRK
jgi:hypothetical protein